MKWLLAKFSRMLLRFAFNGRTMHRVVYLDGQPVIASSGKIVGSRPDPENRRFIVLFMENGGTLNSARKLDVRLLKWDRHLRTWVFND